MYVTLMMFIIWNDNIVVNSN